MDIIFFDIRLSEYISKPKYTLSEKKFLPGRERGIEAIFSMGNGYVGTRNSLEELYPKCWPGTFMAGFYEKDIEVQFDTLVKMPDWTRIKIFVEDEMLDLTKHETLFHRRYIDLNNGCVVREWRCTDNLGRTTSIKIIKFISLFDKHELGKCILIKPENYRENLRVISGIDSDSADFHYLLNQNISMDNHASILMKSKFSDKELIMLQKSNFTSIVDNNVPPLLYTSEIQTKNYPGINLDYQVVDNFSGSFEEWNWFAETGKIYMIKSISTIYTNKETDFLKETAEKHLIKLGADFFETSMLNHVKKWQSRLKESLINIGGNEEDQRLVDFAIYHLIKSGEFSGNDCSIPARNLSGEAYKGHIFWDTEMFLLPFFTYTKPEIARNLLLYRYNTLPQARQNAAKENLKGASFAWESTESGEEMTPAQAILPNGTIIPILSGRYENHISSDIAYTVWKYWQATEDANFLANYGAEILFETARYCENLLKLEEDGFYHVPAVIGPDEYHEIIDDNAYTNYLFRHNFDIAVKACEFLEKDFPSEFLLLKEKIHLEDIEIENWKKYKDKMYSGFDENTKLFEQFKGYYDLEYVDLKQYEPRNVPMDIILGQERTKKTQVIKQADVLMFLFLFGENFSDEVTRSNYEFYEPRTGHGSSLSPGIHSLVAARIGKSEQAYKYFLKNAQIDLNDEFNNSAGGIHIASLGAVWMSVVMGFAGMYPTDRGLIFDPHMPEEWENLEFTITWRGFGININIDKNNPDFPENKSASQENKTKKEQLTINFYLTENKNNTTDLNYKKRPDRGISISLGKENWKELKVNKNYTGVLINEIWRWKS